MLTRIHIPSVIPLARSAFSTIPEFQAIDLNYKEHTGPRTGAHLKDPLIILHGLMGHLNNWRYLAAAPELATDRRVFTLDLRNHGNSPWTKDWSFTALASDIILFLDVQKIDKAVLLGHSLGGKVVMQTALRHPSRVSRMISVDMAPVEYLRGASAMDEVEGIMDAVVGVDFTEAPTRAAVDKQLSKSIKEVGVRQFLLTNLRDLSSSESATSNTKFAWRPNVNVLHENYSHMRLFPHLPGAHFSKPSLFVMGERSGFLTPDAHEAISALFPLAEVRTVSNAGHWVHADQPAAFLKTVGNFLKETDNSPL